MRRWWREDSGAFAVLFVFAGAFLVGVLWYLIGIGDALVFREYMQDAADEGALAAAERNARGMNLVAEINLILAALLGPLLAMKVSHLMYLLNLAITCPQTWNGDAQEVCHAETEPALPSMSAKHAGTQALFDIESTALNALMTTIGRMVPQLGADRAELAGKQSSAFVDSVTVLSPTLDTGRTCGGLPYCDATPKALCDKATQKCLQEAKEGFERLKVRDHYVFPFYAALCKSIPEAFCSNGNDPVVHDIEPVRRDARRTCDRRCDKLRELQVRRNGRGEYSYGRGCDELEKDGDGRRLVPRVPVDVAVPKDLEPYVEDPKKPDDDDDTKRPRRRRGGGRNLGGSDDDGGDEYRGPTKTLRFDEDKCMHDGMLSESRELEEKLGDPPPSGIGVPTDRVQYWMSTAASAYGAARTFKDVLEEANHDRPEGADYYGTWVFTCGDLKSKAYRALQVAAWDNGAIAAPGRSCYFAKAEFYYCVDGASRGAWSALAKEAMWNARWCARLVRANKPASTIAGSLLGFARGDLASARRFVEELLEGGRESKH